MWKTYLTVFLVVTISVIAGALINDYQNDAAVSETAGDLRLSDTAGAISDSVPASKSQNVTVAEQLTALREEIVALNVRLDRLEREEAQVAELSEQPNIAALSAEGVPQQVIDATQSGNTSNAMIAGLVAAGVDSYTAEELVRRQNASQLARLELRDRARREGYIGNAQFRDELRELRQQEVAIKDEVDADTYDRYLYHTGQTNRIAIESVMLGSAAEETGLRAGDMIVSYEDQRMYNWRDLRGATSSGERDETVSITVLRQGDEMTFSIPRGPLGVQLNSVRQDPNG
ncbi:MAG: PDZ domain-containing protein [Pseudomonadota bacterium]